MCAYCQYRVFCTYLKYSDTSHYGNDVPLEVPEGWVWISGKDLFLPMRSTSPSGEKFSYIDIDAIDNKKNIAYPKIILTESAPSRASRYTQYGDTLFSMVRPYLKNIAKVPTEHCIASTGFYICHPYSDINADFIFYMMISDYVVDGLNSFIKGDNSPSIRSRDIDEWKFPLPPVVEQQRIVDEIEKYFSIINTIENEEVALKDSVKKAKSKVLELALSGKLTSDTSHYPQLPDGWEKVRLGDICRLISGTSYSKNDVKPDGIRILRGGNIQYGKVLLLDNDVYISTSLRNKECSLMKGDIIIVASTGSFDLIGKAGYIEQDIPNAQIGAFLRIVRPIDSSISQYLRLIFESTLYRSHIQDLAKGTNINNIKASYITDFCIPLPPMGERKKICNIVKIIFQQLDDIESSMLK